MKLERWQKVEGAKEVRRCWLLPELLMVPAWLAHDGQ